MSKLVVSAAIVMLIGIPIASWAVPPPFEGTLTITPGDPITPISPGPPGIDLTAEWTASTDVTRFEWLVNGFSQGINNVTAGEEQNGDETANFIFEEPGDYEVCFHVYHHVQIDRDLYSCVTVPVVDVTCTWVGESATSDGDDYPGASWFTYTPYDGSAMDATLCAGSTCMDAGTVSFSDPVLDEVTVTITLNAGWRFKDVDENVKIQDYATAPDEAPVWGHFEYKSKAIASPYAAPPVPDNNYYGVHVDLERCVLE